MNDNLLNKCLSVLSITCAWTMMSALTWTPNTAHAVFRDARFNAAPQTNQLIIKYRDDQTNTASRGVRSAAVLNSVDEKMGSALSHNRWLGLGAQVVNMRQRSGSASMSEVINALRADSRVEYVVRDVMYQPAAIPTDPLFAEQWHYAGAPGSIRLDEAWDIAYPNGFADDSQMAPVVVAVIDTGSRPHEDLLDITLPGYDFIANAFIGADGDGRDDDPTDPGDFTAPGTCAPNWPGSPSVWHGAHVMGTVGAVTNNGIGGAGVAPNARIVPVRTLGRCGGALSDVIDGIYWAAGYDVPGAPPNENPAKVINLSLAAPGACNAPMQAAVTAAREAGAVVVVAAGNEAIDAANLSPSNCFGAFTVASVNAQGGRALYSNFGNLVEIAGPGGNGPNLTPPDAGVISTVDVGLQAPEADGYASLVGTSMAAPHVAGVAALVLGAQPDFTPAQVENLLISTVQAFPEECNGCGAGIVDAAQAMAAVLAAQVIDEEEVVEVVEEEDQVEEDVEEEELEDFVQEEIVEADMALSLVSVQTQVVADSVIESPEGVQLIERVTQYDIAVRNLTNAVAQGVTLTNVIPADVQTLEISVTQGTCEAEGTSCSIGDVAALEQVIVSVSASFFAPSASDILLGGLPEGITPQDVFIQSQVSSESVDPVATNNVLLQPLVAGNISGVGLLGLVAFALYRLGRQR